MITAAKFFLYFCLSYLILCVPISHRPLFQHMHAITAPYAQQLLKQVKKASAKTWYQTKRLFLNSTPDLQDTVHTGLSAIQKKKADLELLESHEHYTPEEKALIEEALEQDPSLEDDAESKIIKD